MCACSAASSSAKESTAENQASESSAEESLVVTESETEETADLMKIDTAYGSLYYPAEWKDYLATEESQEDGILTVSFSAKVDAEEYPLFKVMICSEEGDSVGTIKDAEGTTRNVFVENFELSNISDLDEETQNRLYAMQEGVNALIGELD